MQTEGGFTHNTAETVRKAAASTQQRMRSEAERLVDEARDEATEFAVERRDKAASYVDDLADALESARETLDARGRVGAARCTRWAADELHRIGDRVTQESVGRWVDEAEGFARRRPLLFFGGAFLLGYAAMRFVSSGHGADDVAAIDDDPQSGGTVHTATGPQGGEGSPSVPDLETT